MVAHAQPRPVRVTREAVGMRGRGQGKQEDHSGSTSGTFECYRCGGKGHMARNRGQRKGPGGDQTSDPRKALLSEALFDEQSNVWAGLVSSDDTNHPVDGIDLDNIDDSRREWPDEAADPWKATDPWKDADPWKAVDLWKDLDLSKDMDPWKNANHRKDTGSINFIDRMKISGEPIEPTWVVDSGATHHLTPHRELLHRIRSLETPQVFGLADKTTTMKAIEVGEVELRLPSGQRMVLKDVYHVPTSRISLISLSRLLKWGWVADMKDIGGALKRKGERLTLEKKGSLWTVVLGTVHPLVMMAGIPNRPKTVLEEEHQRLGHIGVGRLMELAKEGLLKKGYKEYKDDPFKLTACEPCLQAKITRYPKNGEAPLLAGRGKGIGLEVDITGPFSPSLDGYQHLFVGIERSNGIVFAVPIVTKGEAFDVMKRCVSKLERQTGERIRVIRSDGGLEFGSGNAIEYYRKTGIQHYTTTRYTPELNGASERMIRTLKGMISTMLADSNLPTEYWSYAARYAAVIIMKTSKPRNGQVAWTVLTGRAPGIDSIRRFGERCFVQVPKETRLKSSFTVPKGEPGMI
jgi:hypothetical protein